MSYSMASSIYSRWILRDKPQWTKIADIFAILAVLTLPWSTSLVAIFVLCFLGAVAWGIDWTAYARLIKRPICYLPLSIVALAVIGTLWSDAVWNVRIYAISPTLKLLMLPVLFYHFERSSRGMWALVAFLISCTVLMAVSWAVAFDPTLTLKRPDEPGGRGIFVKNYIAQSQEFALCALALALPILRLLQTRKLWEALLLGAIALGFIMNMAFVIISRTAIVTMPILFTVFAAVHLKWRTSGVIFGALAIVVASAWIASPQLQRTTHTFLSDYMRYKTENIPTSIGLRLEFWKKSMSFFFEAPVVGHGTGSTRGLFEKASTGDTHSATSQVIGNPHNQTLNVAVQWGVLGVISLYATWLVHFLLFRGEGLVAWIGMLVVSQNILTSLFNSHISDFHEGWMYVLGVGIAGGMILKDGSSEKGPEELTRLPDHDLWYARRR